MTSLAKVTITFDDGSTQEFSAAVIPPQVTDTEVDVKRSDGSEETFTPQTPPQA